MNIGKNTKDNIKDFDGLLFMVFVVLLTIVIHLAVYGWPTKILNTQEVILDHMIIQYKNQQKLWDPASRDENKFALSLKLKKASISAMDYISVQSISGEELAFSNPQEHNQNICVLPHDKDIVTNCKWVVEITWKLESFKRWIKKGYLFTPHWLQPIKIAIQYHGQIVGIYEMRVTFPAALKVWHAWRKYLWITIIILLPSSGPFARFKRAMEGFIEDILGWR